MLHLLLAALAAPSFAQISLGPVADAALAPVPASLALAAGPAILTPGLLPPGPAPLALQPLIPLLSSVRPAPMLQSAASPLASNGTLTENMTKAVTAAKKTAFALGVGAKDTDGVGRVKWIPVLSLRPMQFEVGMREVQEKAAKLRAMTPAQRRAYLLAHPIPVVERKKGVHHVNKGPMSRKEERPDDHHHLARAAWEAGIEDIAIRVEKEVDGKKHDKKFWKKMKKRALVYLYDQFGNGPHEPEDLPVDVRGLADDPYRSLAGKVRDLGGYRKTHEPFAEFRWANYFRETVKTHPNKDFDQAVKEGLAAALSSKAKRLPGWVGK